jgi:hypothetical protein
MKLKPISKKKKKKKKRVSLSWSPQLCLAKARNTAGLGLAGT